MLKQSFTGNLEKRPATVLKKSFPMSFTQRAVFS